MRVNYIHKVELFNSLEQAMIDIQENETEYLLTIPQEQKERARAIKGREWDWKRKVWFYPRTNETYDALIAEFSKDLVSISFTRPNSIPLDMQISHPKNHISPICGLNKGKVNIVNGVTNQTEIQDKGTADDTKAWNATTEKFISNLTIVESPSQVLGPEECHYRIQHGDTGYSYEDIFGDYLHGCEEILIEDPYIRLPHQISNFLRFCETIVRISKPKQVKPKRIKLITKFENNQEKDEAVPKLNSIVESLKQYEIDLKIEESSTLHDRSVQLSNGWTIKIGRGLDLYQKPDDWYQIGANDLALRACRETDVDIIRTNV